MARDAGQTGKPMRVRVLKCWSICMSLALAGGCLHPVRKQVDAVICDMAAQPLDVHTPTVADKSPAGDSSSVNGRAGKPVFRGAMPGKEDTAVCQVTAVEAGTADPSPAGGKSQLQKPNQQTDA